MSAARPARDPCPRNFVKDFHRLGTPSPGTAGAVQAGMVARAPTTPSRSRPFTAAIHALAACLDPAILLDLVGTVLFVNDAWDRFARASGGLGQAAVGSLLVERVQGTEPRDALRAILARVVEGAEPASVTMEVNGPDLARLVTLNVSPLRAGAEVVGVTVVQKLVREVPVAEVYEVVAGSAGDYRGQDGRLEQCVCCRRTRRPADPDEWDFVPALVAAPPPDAAFRYCPLCRELHSPLGPLEEG